MPKRIKKTVRGARKIVLEVGWDETPLRIRALGLAKILEGMEGFKSPAYRWMDQQKDSIMQRFFTLYKDATMSEEVLGLHYDFLWRELMTWAEQPLHKTRWSKLQVCLIRRRENMRSSLGKRKKPPK